MQAELVLNLREVRLHDLIVRLAFRCDNTVVRDPFDVLRSSGRSHCGDKVTKAREVDRTNLEVALSNIT
jgi:hypothetical protein